MLFIPVQPPVMLGAPVLAQAAMPQPATVQAAAAQAAAAEQSVQAGADESAAAAAVADHAGQQRPAGRSQMYYLVSAHAVLCKVAAMQLLY